MGGGEPDRLSRSAGTESAGTELAGRRRGPRSADVHPSGRPDRGCRRRARVVDAPDPERRRPGGRRQPAALEHHPDRPEQQPDPAARRRRINGPHRPGCPGRAARQRPGPHRRRARQPRRPRAVQPSGWASSSAGRARAGSGPWRRKPSLRTTGAPRDHRHRLSASPSAPGCRTAACRVRRCSVWSRARPWPPTSCARRAAGVVVLLYHRVGSRTASEVDLPIDLFDAQLDALAETGRVAPLDACLDALASPAPPDRDRSRSRSPSTTAPPTSSTSHCPCSSATGSRSRSTSPPRSSRKAARSRATACPRVVGGVARRAVHRASSPSARTPTRHTLLDRVAPDEVERRARPVACS